MSVGHSMSFSIKWSRSTLPVITATVNKRLAPVMAGHAAETSHALASGGGDTGTELGLMAASVVLVLIAIFLAYLFYLKRTELATSFREKLSGVHKTLLNKYYVDELYGAVVIRPVIYFSLFLWKVFDVVIIDGFINGSAAFYGEISDFLRTGQTGRLRTYATVFVFGVVVIIAYLVLD